MRASRGGVSTWGDREWDRLVRKLRSGDCTPFLGAGASSGTLPLAGNLSRQLAETYGYPFTDRVDNLQEVTQFISVVERDSVTPKFEIAEYFQTLPEPDYSDPTEPHALLSRLPIRVFLTTNYDDFMRRALVRSGKRPMAKTCAWYRRPAHLEGNGSELPPDYEPNRDEPLVYHLHGRLDEPESLVLTEHDYIEFLVNLTKESTSTRGSQVVPMQVLPALTQRPLLFIGYRMRDWSFRMLFHGIVREVADVAQWRHISVQLEPPDEGDPRLQQKKIDYLNEYFDQMRIDVYWGDVGDFCRTLAERLGDA